MIFKLPTEPVAELHEMLTPNTLNTNRLLALIYQELAGMRKDIRERNDMENRPDSGATKAAAFGIPAPVVGRNDPRSEPGVGSRQTGRRGGKDK